MNKVNHDELNELDAHQIFTLYYDEIMGKFKKYYHEDVLMKFVEKQLRSNPTYYANGKYTAYESFISYAFKKLRLLKLDHQMSERERQTFVNVEDYENTLTTSSHEDDEEFKNLVADFAMELTPTQHAVLLSIIHGIKYEEIMPFCKTLKITHKTYYKIKKELKDKYANRFR